VDSFERSALLGYLGRFGTSRSEGLLAQLADGTVASTAGEREASMRSLAELSGARNLEIYERGLQARSFSIQEAALGVLFDFDKQGQASSSVLRWMERRLTGRRKRKQWSYSELPVCVGYLSRPDGGLESALSLLDKFDSELLAVERLVLEVMWPNEKRRGPDRQIPDLDGLGPYGHSYKVYQALEIAIATGASTDTVRLDQDDPVAHEIAANAESEFFALLDAIAGRRGFDSKRGS
ncbi:hypothetical protein, partial [Nocardioides sp. GCM10030258]